MYSNNAHQLFVPTIVFVVSLVCSNTAHALQTTLTGKYSQLGGHTTYAIGGDFSVPAGSATTWFPISKLEYDLDVYMKVARIEFVLDRGVEFGLELQQNINSDAGIMRDSDWLDAPDSLDVYSESVLTLDAKTYDVYIRQKKKIRNLVAAVGAGVLYQEFNFLASDFVQVYPSGRYTGEDPPKGVGITYDVEYIIPYISFSVDKVLSDQWLITFDSGYSPFVKAEGVDHHLARDPPFTIYGDSTGSMVMLSFAVRWSVVKWLFITANASYMMIDTSGTYEFYEDETGAWMQTIQQKTTSEQTNYGLSLNVTF